jgi:hypothetical protein
VTTDDPVRAVVFADAEWARVEATVRQSLKRSGCILPQGVVDAMVGTVLEESLATRQRMAFMVHAFTEEFGNDVTPLRMERLEAVLLFHQRTPDNRPFMPDPEGQGADQD